MKEILNKTHNFCKKYHIYIYLLMALLIVIDYVSKVLVEKFLLTQPNYEYSLIGNFLVLHLLYNPGAFSGFLGDTLAGRIALTSLSVIMSSVMAFILIKYYKKLSNTIKVGLIMSIPGALGNFIDRFLALLGKQAGVIDFIQFDLGFAPFHPFNSFNFADSLLTIGLVVLVVGVTISDIKDSKKQKELLDRAAQRKLQEEYEKETGNIVEEENESQGK